MLAAEDVSFRYGRGAPLSLSRVTLDFRAGVKTAVVGANGAGKSTLFFLLNGLYRPEEGRVLFRGEPLSYRHGFLTRMRSEVAVLLQNPDEQIFRPYVGEDVAFGPANLGLRREEVAARVDEALLRTGIAELKDRSALRLSYGQRKRVALAGVLAMRPRVLIMDEPTAGLDPQMASEVMEIAEQLHREGTTVVLSSHDADLTYAWADELRVLRCGKCVYAGAPEPFYADSEAVGLAGLLPPSAFGLNAGLAALQNRSPAPYPRTPAQLLAKVAGGSAAGPLSVIPAGAGATAAAVREVLQAAHLEAVPRGLSGLSVRKSVELPQLGIDFYFDALDSCLRQCLVGTGAVLICDPALLPAVREAVAFAGQAGRPIELRMLPSVGGA